MSFKKNIYIISDGTGETAATIMRAAVVQYRQHEVRTTRFKNIRSNDQLIPILESAKASKAMIAFTLVTPELRELAEKKCDELKIHHVDLLGPLLDQLSLFFGASPLLELEAGILRTVDEKYYKKIEAIEFTVRHDDGQALEDLDQADIVLVGVSRTSKTPLSIFLSHQGWKVANIPLVLNTPLPEEVYKVDQRKICGLLIDIEPLLKIRQKRIQKIGRTYQATYFNHQFVHKEISYAEGLFQKNRQWPVFNVTDKALEETASEILRIMTARFGKRN